MGLAVALHLVDASPVAQPHELTVGRQDKVNNSYLATVASDLQVGICVKAAKNTPINSRSNADTVEAILGAVFLDCGRDLSEVTRLVRPRIARHLRRLREDVRYRRASDRRGARTHLLDRLA